MENVLKTITRQANLDRILFTPALKKLYFNMAVASGGLTQFKHTENSRNGLKFAADKADDNKHTLLFCAAHELIEGYAQIFEIAQKMLPVIVMAVREETPQEVDQNWSYMQLGEIGWLVFYTHTLQEIYDHLVLAYILFEVRKIPVPIMLLQSTTNIAASDSFTPIENLNLGHTLAGLQSSRAGKEKFDFASAIKAAAEKKEKPTLRAMFEKVHPALREEYANLGYTVPEEGLPFKIDADNGDLAIVSVIPPDASLEMKECAYVRPYCYRPCDLKGILSTIADKKRIAVVEPMPAPGITIPTFYAETCQINNYEMAQKTIPVVVPPGAGVLTQQQYDGIIRIMNESLTQPDAVNEIHRI
jgi:hypothetical protein